VLQHVAALWAYNVRLLEIDAVTDDTLKTHDAEAPKA
jgi:hypothetical protein